jgi:hypothetical protein
VAELPDDATLNLIVEVFGIQNSADLNSDKDFVDPNAALRRRDFDHLSNGHAKRQREGDTAPTILSGIAAPARHLANCLENTTRRFMPAEPQPFLQRVGAGGVDQLIEKTVMEEAIAGRADRPPRTDRHQLGHPVTRHAIVRNAERLILGPGHNGDVRPGNG